MDVILRDDVAHLGKSGQMVKVKDGYARNFLIPSGLAYEASESNKRRVAAEASRRALQVGEKQKQSEAFGAELAKASVTFTVKTGEGDRLFGSITTGDIAVKLAELGHAVDKRQIELEEPIKMLGIYKVIVRLPHDVRPEVRVWVVKE
jgi:large subunit ribosomal protein L9